MPRRPRLVLAGTPVHITQRGVNRAATFFDVDDRQRYLDLLTEIAPTHGLAIHAYVLMDNHVHLLATPAEATGLAKGMRLLNQRYVSALNRRHRRTGTLWEGRFRSCLVDTDGYLLTVYRYIERNPVRAAMVQRAEHYPWSSAAVNLGLRHEPCVTPHATYLALGNDDAERCAAYASWLRAAGSGAELASIREYVRQERALGSAQFQTTVATVLNRPVAARARGRPRRAAEPADDITAGPTDSNG